MSRFADRRGWFRVSRSTMFLLLIFSLVAVSALLVYGFLQSCGFKRCRSTEGTMNVRKLFDSAVLYFDAQLEAGVPIEQIRFPQPAGPTPSLGWVSERCLRGGERLESPSGVWEENETWRALNFSIADPHHGVYQFESDGSGLSARFRATAFIDMDCDGVFTIYQRFGEVESDGEGVRVHGGAGLTVIND